MIMQIQEGIVTSAKMQKTVVVIVHRYRIHPKYKKKFRVSATFMAHDEAGTCKEGDAVTIVETRPMSKRKRWRVVTPEELQALLAARPKTDSTGSAAPDEMLVAELPVRTRKKSRGVRMKEKTEQPAAPAAAAPSAEAPKAEAPKAEEKPAA